MRDQPGLTAAATGHHFAGRSNRFWRVIHLAGFTPAEISPQDDRAILQYGCGLTAVVKRPTRERISFAREFIAAAAEFDQKLARYAPRFVAFSARRRTPRFPGSENRVGCNRPGCRGERLGAAQSERRNLAFSLDDLVDAYRQLRLQAKAVSGLQLEGQDAAR